LKYNKKQEATQKRHSDGIHVSLLVKEYSLLFL